MKLDDEIRKVHDKYWDTEQQAARQTAVLLVEGDDDRDVVEGMISRRAPYWDQRLKIVVAGGRRTVIQRMGLQSTFPAAYGLVDRDTWSNDEVDAQRANNARLYFTEGWCIENIFLRPDFLRQYDARIAEMVAAERESWVRAGAFWWTVQRVREAQQGWQERLEWSKYYGAPHPNLEFSSQHALMQTLAQRIPDSVCKDVRLDFAAIAETFQMRLEYVLNLPVIHQWQVGVHGKCVFEKVLKPLLEIRHTPRNQQDSKISWRGKLALHPALGRPAPFDELMAILFP